MRFIIRPAARGRCKSWTPDSGLDHGLLDHGLDRGLNGGLDFGPDFGLVIIS